MGFRFLWRRHTQSSIPQQSLIANFWPGAPDEIDAAVERRSSDRVFLFKGTTFPVRPPAVRFSFELFCFLSLQTARCGPSAATIWSLATQSPFPASVFQAQSKRWMPLFWMKNLARCCFLWTACSTGVRKAMRRCCP